VFVSLCYSMLRWLLQIVALRVRSHEWKDVEIVVLRHELAILRLQTRRPAITPLTALCLLLPADFCLRRAGRPSSSHRRLFFAGIDAWWRSDGLTRIRLGTNSPQSGRRRCICTIYCFGYLLRRASSSLSAFHQRFASWLRSTALVPTTLATSLSAFACVACAKRTSAGFVPHLCR